MSDVDRLRAAADSLDDGGVHGQREWPEDRFASCRWHNVAVQGHDVVASASALADTILGGGR